MIVTLPFPPSSLSGHAKGNRWSHSKAVAEYREMARERAGIEQTFVPGDSGDIRIHFRFVPGDRRGDRCNFPNRLKPYIDGIADALCINDRRFLPSYEFAPPEKPGRVEITVSDGLRPFGDIAAEVVARAAERIGE